MSNVYYITSLPVFCLLSRVLFQWIHLLRLASNANKIKHCEAYLQRNNLRVIPAVAVGAAVAAVVVPVSEADESNGSASSTPSRFYITHISQFCVLIIF